MNNQVSEPMQGDAGQRLEAFRFFTIDGKRERGDRFLQPWLFCHVYASGSKSRGERKRAGKELARFFQQKELVRILEDAGEDGRVLLEAQLFDSADKYLTICREDEGFGKKLFGLMRMKSDEKEDKIISDVYLAMLPLLLLLTELEERFTMIHALDQACRRLYPQRLEDMAYMLANMKDKTLCGLLEDFDCSPPEDGELPPEH